VNIRKRTRSAREEHADTFSTDSFITYEAECRNLGTALHCSPSTLETNLHLGVNRVKLVLPGAKETYYNLRVPIGFSDKSNKI
jgi:hypothetical protein